MDLPFRKYSPLWSKYRPAVLQMMVAAQSAPQQYKLMPHEIKVLDEKKKGSFGFQLQATGTKAQNNIRESEIAQDLLHMLLQSRKAIELLNTNTYEFQLDKHFVLHVRHLATTQTTETSAAVEASLASVPETSEPEVVAEATATLDA